MLLSFALALLPIAWLIGWGFGSFMEGMAGIGKMICPQGIAIGASATGLPGSERAIMGSVLRYFALYLVFAGIICAAGSTMGF